MKCDNCGKKPATVHLTEIDDDGNKHEQHLCDECAQEIASPAPKVFNPAEILTTLINQVAPEFKEMAKTVCDHCGLSYLEFRSQGRLGCSHDYDAFEKGLVPILEKIHGSAEHKGKVPNRSHETAQQQSDYVRLRRELEEAVAVEDYERAAVLRDKLKELMETEA